MVRASLNSRLNWLRAAALGTLKRRPANGNSHLEVVQLVLGLDAVACVAINGVVRVGQGLAQGVEERFDLLGVEALERLQKKAACAHGKQQSSNIARELQTRKRL